MLVTTCGHCGARFRVTPEQLNLRQGQVRCGQCRQVFSGFEALERADDDDPGSSLPFAPAAPDAREAEDAADAVNAPFAGEAEDRAVRREAPVGPVAQRVPVGPLGKRRLPDIPDLQLEPAPVVRPSRAWVFGVVLLLLLLALQLAYYFRGNIAQRHPELRPFLESACAPVGCTVPWVNDESSIALEDSELLEVPGKPGQIALQARIRNLSPSAQEFPHLLLTLTDISGRPAVRRVLRPADYLGHAPVPGEVMTPRSEALVSLRLETAGIRPTGYELYLFYP